MVDQFRTQGNAPAIIPCDFPFQSYFDASGAAITPIPAQALKDQPTNQGAVQSTLKDYQEEVRAVGLTPWSETPVMVRFRSPDSPWLPLKPGQVIRPYTGMARDGFEYGLPTGWLGGGKAYLMPFRAEDPMPVWRDDAELLFHCFRTVVRESAPTPPAVGPRNWPTHFPWENAYRLDGTRSVAQNGKPVFSVRPTRTFIRHSVDLATAARVRIVLWGSDEYAHAADGLPPAANSTNAVAVDISLPANNYGGLAANPMVTEIPYEITRLSSTNGGITVDCEQNSPMIGQNVEILRYGRL